MKLGLCGTVEQAALIKACGYDYIEMNLSALTALSEADFYRTVHTLERNGLPCLACNVFMPGSVRITGKNVDPDATRQYVQAALTRAEQIGAKLVVFGSSAARSIPGGFPAGTALLQMLDFSIMAAEIAADHDLFLALEPLAPTECNLINRVSEGWILMHAVNHPHFKLLADTYHMAIGQEDLSVLEHVGPDLYHVHTSTIGRKIPLDPDILPQRLLIQTLKSIGYDRTLSIEAGWRQDLETEAQEAQNLFRRLLAE